MFKRWLWCCLLLCGLTTAQAQPIVGQIFLGSMLSESGVQIPLPPSAWRVTSVSEDSLSGSPLRVVVLRSGDSRASVPYLVVRYSLQPAGNWGSACDEVNAAAFDVERHGTLSTQLLQKCSRQFTSLLPGPTTTHRWWKELERGIDTTDQALMREPMLLSEFTVSQWRVRWLRVESFTRTTWAGVRPSEVRDAVRANRILFPLVEPMRAWSRGYVDALEAAINKRIFQTVPWPEVQIGASVDDKIREMSPPRTSSSSSSTALPNSREVEDKIRQMSPSKQGVAASGVTPSGPDVDEKIRQMSGGNRVAVGNPGAVPAAAAVTPPPQAYAAQPPTAQRPAQAAAPSLQALAAAPASPAAAPTPAVSAQDLAKLSAEIARLREELKTRPASAEPASKTEPPAPAAAPVSSARRLAFVIGNDSYQSVPKLQNARTDAKAMADMLTRSGYRVRMRLDLTERAMKDELRAFKAEVQGGDEVLFFFAGHGVQLAGANYLLPTDVRSDSEDQVRDDALPLQKVLDDLQDRKARFALAIVDACRDNPFKGAGRNIGTRGLAPTAAATGQMVMFSAGAGQQALDRLGERDREPNGLFTRVLLKEMDKPGVSVDRVLRTVRTQVVEMARTVGHEQVPALYDQSIGEFYFRR